MVSAPPSEAMVFSHAKKYIQIDTRLHKFGETLQPLVDTRHPVFFFLTAAACMYIVTAKDITRLLKLPSGFGLYALQAVHWLATTL